MQNRQGLSKSQRLLWVEISSLLVLALCVFTLAALWTYHPSDPSPFARSIEAARNACGRIGAYVSATGLQLFGLGAFLLPAAFLFVSVSLHRREGALRVLTTLAAMIFAVLSLTVFLALQWKYWPYAGTLLLTGGAFGAWISEQLLRELNFLGSSITSLLIFALAIVVATPLSVARALSSAIVWASNVTWKVSKWLTSYALYVGLKGGQALGNAAGRTITRQLSALHLRLKSRPVSPEGILAESLPVATPPAADPQQEESEYAEFVPLNPIGPPTSISVSAQSPAIVESDLPTLASSERKPKQSLKRGAWKLPTIEFLRKPPKIESAVDREKLVANSQILAQKFADFGIQGEVTAVRPGPVITLYEFKPGPGVKVSRIAALADDLSMALSAQSVRILAPLPGKAVVGIEIPSDTRETVYLREFLQHPDFYGTKHVIPVVMGKDISGQTVLSDLARMPHLLCAGQTGAGKSVFMNGLICSLFYRFTPDELRMILVDPKFIEFRAYQDIPHLLLPVVDDPKQAATALRWAVREMERRYRILAKMGARNLASFNHKIEEMGADTVRDLLLAEDSETVAQQTSGSDWIEAFEPDEAGVPQVGKLPNIVIIIDELADLMMVARKEVEISIARIAQKARAAGIHLVIATQRPSTDVVTGLIKANLPSRVSFQLASYVDSKTILDRAGAERLLGQGDMLFIPPGVSQAVRLHGAFVEDDEIHKVTAFLKAQGKPLYRDEILLTDDEEDEDNDDESAQDDALFGDAVDLVKRSGHASASFLQRHLKVGYNRAARMIETMEMRGIVGPAEGARPREVLIR